jgi:hypothetical protein
MVLLVRLSLSKPIDKVCQFDRFPVFEFTMSEWAGKKGNIINKSPLGSVSNNRDFDCASTLDNNSLNDLYSILIPFTTYSNFNTRKLLNKN